MRRVNAGNHLLTCPSCGSSAITKEEDTRDEYSFRVYCDDCGYSTLRYKSAKQAEKAWNKGENNVTEKN